MDHEYYEYFNHWNEFLYQCKYEEFIHQLNRFGPPHIRRDLIEVTRPAPAGSSSRSNPSHSEVDLEEIHFVPVQETDSVVTFRTNEQDALSSPSMESSSQHVSNNGSSYADDGGDNVEDAISAEITSGKGKRDLSQRYRKMKQRIAKVNYR